MFVKTLKYQYVKFITIIANPPMMPRDANKLKVMNAPNGVPIATITGAICKKNLPQRGPVKASISCCRFSAMSPTLELSTPNVDETDAFNSRANTNKVPSLTKTCSEK